MSQVSTTARTVSTTAVELPRTGWVSQAGSVDLPRTGWLTQGGCVDLPRTGW